MLRKDHLKGMVIKDHRKKPGTYEERKTVPRGTYRKESSCRDIVKEMMSTLLKPGEDSVFYSDAVFFVERFGRNADDAAFFVDNLPGAMDGIQIKGEDDQKRIFFSL